MTRRITQTRPAGDDHQVVTVVGSNGGYCRRPCADCPWRLDAVGEFPAEAFRHSAPTSYDMSDHIFACHQAGVEKSKVCAGFLLRGSMHSLPVRIGLIEGTYRYVSDGGYRLHESYRAMAIANGVDPADPVLEPCR